MARPRKDQPGPGARERIINAFWGMLAEGPYDRVTVRALASKAQVNHNTIYRHFESVEHVAKAAIAEVYSIEVAYQMLALFAHPELVDAEKLAERGLDERVDKVVLAMNSGSPVLVATIQEKIKGCWMQIAGTSWEDLPHETKLELSFILGGITSMLRTLRSADDILAMRSLVTSRVGTAARQTLAELISSTHGEG